jgi:hypothetical protein
MTVFCITCAVLVWTKSSWHIFCLSVGVPVTFFMGLAHLIWNCEPFILVCKVEVGSLLVFCTQFMRIGGSRLLHILVETSKIRVRVTKVQTLIGTSLVLAASLHLAFYNAVFSFAEIVSLWHYWRIFGLLLCGCIVALWRLEHRYAQGISMSRFDV